MRRASLIPAESPSRAFEGQHHYLPGFLQIVCNPKNLRGSATENCHRQGQDQRTNTKVLKNVLCMDMDFWVRLSTSTSISQQKTLLGMRLNDHLLYTCKYQSPLRFPFIFNCVRTLWIHEGKNGK